MDHAYLQLDRLEKRFGKTLVTRGVSLTIERRSLIALLGPSGSGKTTVLRLVAGFETPDGGRIVVDGEDVTAMAPERRRFGMVFQHYALFPHMSVGENVAFGLESQGMRRPEITARVAETLRAVELPGFESRRVTQLSGGQQQRIALARALAPQPRVLLLDEPLSNLDPTLRERTRRELKRLIRAIGITTLFVTHEQEEAFELGDRVAVLNAGRLEQVGSPEDLYERPASRFVASFIGRVNLLRATWEDGRARLASGPHWTAIADAPIAAGARVDLLVRPEGLAIGRSGDPAALPGQILDRRFAGRISVFAVRLDDSSEVELAGATASARVGDRVFVVPSADGPTPRVYPSDAAP